MFSVITELSDILEQWLDNFEDELQDICPEILDSFVKLLEDPSVDSLNEFVETYSHELKKKIPIAHEALMNILKTYGVIT